jgi:cold shock CspA family protein
MIVTTGTVTAFDPESGLGEVADGHGVAYRFHCTTISDGSRHIELGQPVTFLVGAAGPGQWEAIQVTALT